MQVVAEVHETPERLFQAALVELGVVWIVQAVPFQTSASVEEVFALRLYADPTAVHAVADVHEIPESELEK